MSPPALAPWVDVLLASLAGGAAVAAVAAGVAALARRAATGLTAWRAAVVLVAVLPPAELCGLSGEIGDRLRPAARESATGAATAAPAPTTPVPDPVAPAAWPAVVWGAGTVLVFARLAVGQVLLRRFRRRLLPASAALARRVRAVAQRCGYAGAVRAAVAPCLRSPFVLGPRRPVLAVPADFDTAFTPAQQDAVIAHELGHLAHRDPLWQLLAGLAVALVWWNPLAWWARARHRDAGEAAADEFTGHVEDGPVLLAESLVLIGRRVAAPAGAVAARGPRSGLARRVRRLLALPPAVPSPRPRGLGVAAVLVAALLAWPAARALAGPARPSLLAQARAALAPKATEPKPLRVQLAPDRRTDEEIVARLGLTADQTRRYRTLRAEIEADTREMHAHPEGRVERGLAINRKLRAGLADVFTAEQHRTYLDYWRGPPVPAAPALAEPAASRVMAPLIPRGPAAAGG